MLLNLANVKQVVIILGVKSPLIVEYEESCLRANITISAAVRFSTTCRAIDLTYVIPVEKFDPTIAHGGFLPCAFAPARRRSLVEKGETMGLSLSKALIDPTAIIARSARISNGAYVNVGVIIGGVSMVRECAFINRGTTIGHHCVIGSFASIGPSVTMASNVRVEDDVIIGAGVVIIPDIVIGEGAVISAGAIVTRDVPPEALVVGERGRIIPDGARKVALSRGNNE